MNALFESALITAIFASAIRGTTPILLAALGETYAERSGLLNLGIEGMMVAGAFSSFAVENEQLVIRFCLRCGRRLDLGPPFWYFDHYPTCQSDRCRPGVNYFCEQYV